MSWTKDDQTRLELLRAKELSGTLADAEERTELAGLIARIDAEEAEMLAPEMERLRTETAAVVDEREKLDTANEELARLLAQQQTLVVDARKFLDEFDRRRASILDGLARVARRPLPAA